MRLNHVGTIFAALLVSSLLAACDVAPAASTPAVALPPTASVPPTIALSPTVAPTVAPSTTPALPTATLPPSPTPVPSWTTFRAQVGFNIDLPGTPTEETVLSESLIGPVTSYTATLMIDPQHSYTVVALIYPGRPITRDDPGGVSTLEEVRDQTIKRVTARAVHERSVFLGPFVGRELAVATGGDNVFRSRLYLVGTTLYQLTVRSMLPEGNPDVSGSDVSRFFKSFALNAPPTPQVPAWHVFRLDGVKATLALPVQPIATQHSASTLVGLVATTEYIAAQDDRGVRYSISASEYPDRVFAQDDPDGSRTIDAQRDALVGATGGQLQDEQPITYGEARGREVVVGLPDGGYARARFYVVGHRLYQLTLQTRTVISSPTASTPLVPNYEEIGRFFLSFGPDV